MDLKEIIEIMNTRLSVLEEFLSENDEASKKKLTDIFHKIHGDKTNRILKIPDNKKN